MTTMNVSALKPGMIVAKPILTKRGQVIATAGTKLTSQLIAKFAFYRIDTVTIDESQMASDTDSVPVDTTATEVASEDTPTEETVTEAPAEEEHTENESISRRTLVRATPQFQNFQNSYTRNMVTLQDDFAKIIDGNVAEACDHLLQETSELFASKTSLDLFNMIHSMRAVDDTVYAHSLNVALISRAIGKWLHLSKDDLNTLTLAALLHDIGKTQIPSEILNKTEKLTDAEFDIIRSHAKLGYKILKETKLDTRIKLVALQHHERFDGSGYPRGLEGDEIEYFASIVAIADVYDAMTAARSYRAPKCAFQVIYAFEEEGFQKYNPKVIYTFLNRVAACYSNSRVLLSDGTPGRIVYLNKNVLSRPIIETDHKTLIDLSAPKNRELYIKAIV